MILIYSEQCNLRCNQLQNIFISPQRNPKALDYYTQDPYSYSSPALDNHELNLLSIAIDLPLLDISYKWNLSEEEKGYGVESLAALTLESRKHMQICVLHTGLDDSVNWFSEIKITSQHLTVLYITGTNATYLGASTENKP